MQWLFSIRSRLLALVAALSVLSACQEVLYSELTESDANEMVALLVLSGIPAERQNDQGGNYSVLVDESNLALAVTVLRNSGLPREKFSSLGEVFGNSGLVGTPFEERVRFTHAINEELSHTITQIKGVERARVHVVVPPEERFGKTADPARASVVVFHDRSFDPTAVSGRIKTLVAFAVPKLEVENVSVSYFLTSGFVVQPSATDAFAPGSAEAATLQSNRFLTLSGSGLPLLSFASVLLAVILIRLGVLGWRRSGRRERTHG